VEVTHTSARSRRQFLRGRFDSRACKVVRPPWAVAEAAFEELCTRCDHCLVACPEGILVRGSGGYPEVDFRRGGCSFCGKCVDVCEPGALASGERDPAAAWRLAVSIAERCLSNRGVVCRACGDACGERAIRFRPRLGGGAELLLEGQRCNGCGACVSVCPEDAVSLKSVAEATS